MMQMVLDMSQERGIFVQGCKNVQQIFKATLKREAPMHLMPPEFPELSPLVEKMLQKNKHDRYHAVQAVRDPWFHTHGEEGTGKEDFSSSEAFQHLHAHNRFATMGLSAFQKGNDRMSG